MDKSTSAPVKDKILPFINIFPFPVTVGALLPLPSALIAVTADISVSPVISTELELTATIPKDSPISEAALIFIFFN